MEQNSLLSQLSLSLIKTLSNDSGLQALVDLGYKTLGNPFTITDFSVKLLATTGNTTVTDDPVWNELKMNNNFIFQTYSYYVKSSLFSEIASNEVPFYWSDPYCKYPRLIGKIRINNRDFANMVVCAHNRDFEERDKEVVALLCDAFSIELQKAKYNDVSQGLTHQSFLQDLLDSKFEDEGIILERIKVLGLKFKSKLFIISIDIQNLDKSRSTLPYIRDEVEHKLSYAKAIVYRQNIIILASFDNERHFKEIELKPLKEFIKTNNLLAGISRPFSKFTEVKAHHFESLEAIKLGNTVNSEQHFYQYEDYIIFDFITNYSHGEKAKRLIHRSLLRLIKYDRENGTDYVLTFYTYLCNFKNIKDSANSLKIHRNTMFHRVAKIQDLLDVDLNDGDVLFQLYLSYKILEFFKIDLP